MSQEIKKPVVMGEGYLSPSVKQHLDKWKVTTPCDASALSTAAAVKTGPAVETGTGMITPSVARHLKKFGDSTPSLDVDA